MKNWFWILFTFLAFSGCASARYESARPAASYDGARAYQKMAVEAEAAPTAYDESGAITGSATGDSEKKMESVEGKAPGAPGAGVRQDVPEPPVPAAPTEKRPSVARMIVYAARLAIEVVEPEKSLEAALALMQKMGGYLSQRSDYAVEIRIPAAMFFDFIKEIETYGTVTDRVIASEDVTEQYADLALRMENLTAMRARLMELLEQARTVEERLAIERELSRINEEIEVIGGRMRMLKNLADYATVYLRFTPRYANGMPQPQKQPTPVWWVRNFDISQLFSGQQN